MSGRSQVLGIAWPSVGASACFSLLQPSSLLRGELNVTAAELLNCTSSMAVFSESDHGSICGRIKDRTAIRA